MPSEWQILGYVVTSNKEFNLKYSVTEVDGKKWITRTPQIYS